METRPGITVHLRAPERAVDYPDAKSARVAAGGSPVVLRTYPRGFPEAIDEIVTAEGLPAAGWPDLIRPVRTGASSAGRPHLRSTAIRWAAGPVRARHGPAPASRPSRGRRHVPPRQG